MKVSFNFIILMSLAMLSACGPSHDVTIRVTPPAGFNSDDTVHMVGAFNDWTISGPSAVELEYQDGELITQIQSQDDDLFFSFVRNKDWQNMPVSNYGKGLCNFHKKLEPGRPDVLVNIPAWKSDKPTQQAPTTLTGNIETIKNFRSEQLNRNMDVLVYLPSSYKNNQLNTYPVLYMLDGQNVFDSATAYSDEWRVDELLTELEQSGGPEVIVIAVPNSPDRWQEYNPWDFVNWSGEAKIGKGKQTIDFIKNSLKPYVDQQYRTDKNKTGLAGSSLGGLMAIYAALEHSDVFGFVAAFSPSLSIENGAGQNVLFKALENSKLPATKIYYDMGKPEYGDYNKFDQLHAKVLNVFEGPTRNIKLVKDDIGRHCELDWSKRFPAAITWLLASN